MWGALRFRLTAALPKAVRVALLAVAFLLCLAAGTIGWIGMRLEPLSLARARMETEQAFKRVPGHETMTSEGPLNFSLST